MGKENAAITGTRKELSNPLIIFASKQGPADRSILNNMNTQQLPSSWQLGDKVQVIFPGNGKLQGKIIKVSFPTYGEVLYDVEIPYATNDGNPEPEAGKRGFFRIHGVDQWFLSHTQEDWDKMNGKGSILPEFAQLLKPFQP